MSRTRTPYIKPTRFKHDSGFRTFEVGYCEIDNKNNAINIQVLGKYSDHINQDYMMLVGRMQPFCLNMDLTTNGYIRFFMLDAKNKILCWDNDSGFSTSTMTLTIKERLDQAA